MTTAVEVAEKGHQLAAWVNFNGTLAMTVGSSYGPDAPPADYSSPNPIRAAYNVSSITDNGTGDYTVNFTTAMPDANFCVVGSAGNSTVDPSNENLSCVPVDASSARVESFSTNNAVTNQPFVMVTIFR